MRYRLHAIEALGSSTYAVAFVVDGEKSTVRCTVVEHDGIRVVQPELDIFMTGDVVARDVVAVSSPAVSDGPASYDPCVSLTALQGGARITPLAISAVAPMRWAAGWSIPMTACRAAGPGQVRNTCGLSMGWREWRHTNMG